MMVSTRPSREARGGEAMDLFDVYVLRFDVNEERATRGLMQVFGLSEAASRIFVHSVPRVGKRNVPTNSAERYVRALHAVGAVVECRRSGSAPLGDSANRVQPMSLPAPAITSFPGGPSPPHIMQDSLGVMAPLQYSPDMPTIPKAPRIPADLHAIRQRKGPDSMAPNWRNASDPNGKRGQSMRLDNSVPLTNSMDGGGFWSPDSPQVSSDPLGQLESPFNHPDPADADEHEPETESGAEQKRVDTAALDGDLLSPSPLSPSPFAPSQPQPRSQSHSHAPSEAGPWYMNATHQLLLACLIIGGMVLAMSSGVFETDAARRTRAFQSSGIDAGEFEPAASYVGKPGNEFDGLPSEQLSGLLEALTRAGSPGVWIANITRRGAQRAAHTLVVELPSDPLARRAILLEPLKSGALRDGLPADTGQRYARLVF
jgi:hypothetical protein